MNGRKLFLGYATPIALSCGLVISASIGSARAQSYAILHSFQGGSDGIYPRSSLIDVGGVLYGTTWAGGGPANCGYPGEGCGSVFSLSLSSNVEDVTYAFPGGIGGDLPQAGVVYVSGMLYGTASAGGDYSSCSGGCGIVFELNPETGKSNVLHSFKAGSDGEAPYSSLIDVGGVLYGTTLYGGAFGQGTVFSVRPKSRVERVVYSFKGENYQDGASPEASLLNVGGILYGTTSTGGENGFGTVFSLDPKTGIETVLHSFQLTDGAYPAGGLISVGGALYGSTADGGGCDTCYGYGTVFSVNPTTAVEAVVHSFGGSDGAGPVGNLVNIHGTLFGATGGGGASNLGTVFSLALKTRAETVLHSFQGGSDGDGPDAGLVYAGGTLYGTTDAGDGYGTVFSISP